MPLSGVTIASGSCHRTPVAYLSCFSLLDWKIWRGYIK